MKKIFSILLALVMIFTVSVTAFAAPVAEATIDMDKTGSIDIYKYDLTNAEKDGVWDSSYVSTGIRDVAGVENVLGGGVIRSGDTDDTSDLGIGQKSYGYAIKGVEFTYLKIADIYQYSVSEDGTAPQTAGAADASQEHVEVLYGIKAGDANLAMLQAIGLSYADAYAPATRTADGNTFYYFQSDVLINGLKASLDANSTTVKNALENYVKNNGGMAMTETDAYGHTAASNLPLGLYLIVETKVPEMVTDTTAPFLVSVPMTSVNGTNVAEGSERDGGSTWLYDITLYPKNLTGIPTLEKTLREDKADTGKNNGSASITDGYAHTGTASDGDVIDYQIISTLPSITSKATYLAEYGFFDTLSKGLTYSKNDVVLEFFKDSACTDKITTWNQSSGKFTVSYNDVATGSAMTIAMTAAGLTEINSSNTVYTGASMVNSGYSDCTLRITYKATLNSDSTVVYGDDGNPNQVVMTWRRTSSSYYDTLIDDAHVYTYGIDLTKKFSDDRGDFAKVEFIAHNDTDDYFVKAELKDGIWYVTDHVEVEADATHLIPQDGGKLIVKGLEDDSYTITEVRTDNAYTLLKESIKVVISQEESEELCDIYSEDVLGLIQNDPRYASVDPGLYKNMPQKHLEHMLLTASATVDGNDVAMEKDGDSENALAPLTVVNTRGFDLPQTGGNGNWMFPVVGLSVFALCVFAIVILLKKRNQPENS